MDRDQLLQRALSDPTDVRFDELTALAVAFDFRLSRKQGNHFIFLHDDIPELLSLQNVDGKAKPYQVRQLFRLVERYTGAREAS